MAILFTISTLFVATAIVLPLVFRLLTPATRR